MAESGLGCMQHVGSFLVAHGLLSSCGYKGSSVGTVRTLYLGALWWRQLGSVVAARGLSCPEACEILVPGQGWNLHPLHWKADC